MVLLIMYCLIVLKNFCASSVKVAHEKNIGMDVFF